MPVKPTVTIIIPTYKRTDKLIKCLESIRKSSYQKTEVIVVNDNPNEDLRHQLNGVKIRLFQNKRELYWTRCRNKGAKLARGRILFFVDDDNILEKHAIERLVRKYDSLSHTGLLGPIMYKADGSLWFYGATETWINPYAKKVPEKALTRELIETDVIPNAYMISRALYSKIGMEDPDFLYHEEVDLAQRLKFSGYKNFIYTKAKTVHDLGNSASRLNVLRAYITIKSHIMIERKYAPLGRLILFVLIFLTVNTLYYLLYKIPTSAGTGKLELYKAYVKGFKDGLNYPSSKLRS